jgi:predicted metal-dependent hydrolase
VADGHLTTIEHETLVVHDLMFELRRSSRRTNIGIVIDRRGELLLYAPQACPREYIQRVAEEKYRWIYSRLAKKEMLFRPPRQKEFLTGESFSYLGYTYLLQVLPTAQQNDAPPLGFTGGWFLLREDERTLAQEHFISWYSIRAQEWLEHRVEDLAQHVGVQPEGINVRDLGYRWGSCGQSKVLNFHWRIAQLPPLMIDYIIVHELAHIHESRHTPVFWRRVRQVIPDFLERKQWLAENGSRFS